MQVAKDLYADLYKSDACANEVIDHYIESSTLERPLSDLDKLECEGEISYNECEFAVKSMKKNKALGLDGICIEFYQTFWLLFGNLLQPLLS